MEEKQPLTMIAPPPPPHRRHPLSNKSNFHLLPASWEADSAPSYISTPPPMPTTTTTTTTSPTYTRLPATPPLRPVSDQAMGIVPDLPGPPQEVAVDVTSDLSPLSRLSETTPFLYGYGTELAPILEQRSVATLRTRASMSTSDLSSLLHGAPHGSGSWGKAAATAAAAGSTASATGVDYSRHTPETTTEGGNDGTWTPRRLRRQHSFSLDESLLPSRQQQQQRRHPPEPTPTSYYNPQHPHGHAGFLATAPQVQLTKPAKGQVQLVDIHHAHRASSSSFPLSPAPSEPRPHAFLRPSACSTLVGSSSGSTTARVQARSPLHASLGEVARPGHYLVGEKAGSDDASGSGGGRCDATDDAEDRRVISVPEGGKAECRACRRAVVDDDDDRRWAAVLRRRGSRRRSRRRRWCTRCVVRKVVGGWCCVSRQAV
ncbi:hypothetical protein F4780DRAFT_698587 [Xylariomycetidae sp. FL0641]|nr:hypothetical protein F4780DRAFT_698587 [Xylariomycetidae sp. FL0641]